MSIKHHYGSRIWWDRNYDILPGLGEDRTCKQSWDRGDEPAVLPNAEQFGDDLCLTNGATYAKGYDTDKLRNGFAIECYTPEVPLDPYWEIASSWDVCSLQFFYATIIKWMYQQEVEKIRLAFIYLLGPLAEIWWIRHEGIFPDLVVVKMPTFTIVVADGTDNFQQLAMQAFAAISRPQNFGLYSTYPFWYDSATYVDERLTELEVNPLRPIMLAGHSHGAVALDNLAARYLGGNPNRVIRTMTFGAPKPGDERMQDILTRAMGISLANEDDIVTAVPPTRLVIFPVALILSRPDLFLWENWFPEPNRARMNFDGDLKFNIDPTIDGALLTHMVNQIALGQPFNIVAPHFITEYRRRIESRCRQTEWPVSPCLWEWLHDRPCVPGGVGLSTPTTAAYGGVGLVSKIGLLCPCCATSHSPARIRIHIAAAGYWIDGMDFDVDVTKINDDCIGTRSGQVSGQAYVIDLNSFAVSPGTVEPFFSAVDFSRPLVTDFRCTPTVTAFTCTPWAFAATGEIFELISGVLTPTGIFATMTGTPSP